MSKKKLVVLAFCFLLISSLLPAQKPETKSDFTHYRYGIGVVFHDIWQEMFYNQIVPTIYIPMNISKNYKLEPQISYSKDTDTNDNEEDDTITRFTIGLGVFHKTNHFKTIIYYGLRFGYTEIRRDESNDEYNYEQKQTFITPTLGGEHFFTSNFSLGCEVGYRFISFKEELNYPDSSSNDHKIRGTETNLFLRFYFL